MKDYIRAYSERVTHSKYSWSGYWTPHYSPSRLNWRTRKEETYKLLTVNNRRKKYVELPSILTKINI